jgi:hypothetical protein
LPLPEAFAPAPGPGETVEESLPEAVPRDWAAVHSGDDEFFSQSIFIAGLSDFPDGAWAAAGAIDSRSAAAVVIKTFIGFLLLISWWWRTTFPGQQVFRGENCGITAIACREHKDGIVMAGRVQTSRYFHFNPSACVR